MRDYQLEDYDDAFVEYMRMRAIIKENSLVFASQEKTTDSKTSYEERKRESSKRRSEERKKEKAMARIPELEAKLAMLDEELFGDAASNYVRAAEIEEEKARQNKGFYR
jgi:hypothetical protein